VRAGLLALFITACTADTVETNALSVSVDCGGPDVSRSPVRLEGQRFATGNGGQVVAAYSIDVFGREAVRVLRWAQDGAFRTAQVLQYDSSERFADMSVDRNGDVWLLLNDKVVYFGDGTVPLCEEHLGPESSFAVVGGRVAAIRRRGGSLDLSLLSRCGVGNAVRLPDGPTVQVFGEVGALVVARTELGYTTIFFQRGDLWEQAFVTRQHVASFLRDGELYLTGGSKGDGYQVVRQTGELVSVEGPAEARFWSGDARVLPLGEKVAYLKGSKLWVRRDGEWQPQDDTPLTTVKAFEVRDGATRLVGAEGIIDLSEDGRASVPSGPVVSGGEAVLENPCGPRWQFAYSGASLWSLTEVKETHGYVLRNRLADPDMHSHASAILRDGRLLSVVRAYVPEPRPATHWTARIRLESADVVEADVRSVFQSQPPPVSVHSCAMADSGIAVVLQAFGCLAFAVEGGRLTPRSCQLGVGVSLLGADARCEVVIGVVGTGEKRLVTSDGREIGIVPFGCEPLATLVSRTGRTVVACSDSRMLVLSLTLDRIEQVSVLEGEVDGVQVAAQVLVKTEGEFRVRRALGAGL
jgi:hypothetical protein